MTCAGIALSDALDFPVRAVEPFLRGIAAVEAERHRRFMLGIRAAVWADQADFRDMLDPGAPPDRSDMDASLAAFGLKEDR